jgi:8-oxo-dGTP pyrophosphatase MutT (NUDIX family)
MTVGTEPDPALIPRVWKPNLTVAAVIERDGHYLLVEEASDDPADGDSVFNQPAGHVEAGEGIVAAAMREVLEETGWRFTPLAFVGSYYWTHPSKRITYLRFCFAGNADAHDSARILDHGIVRTHWLARSEVEALGRRLRSPMVLACIRDYEAGHSFPLHLVREL